jgi:hypothetical protein
MTYQQPYVSHLTIKGPTHSKIPFDKTQAVFKYTLSRSFLSFPTHLLPPQRDRILHSQQCQRQGLHVRRDLPGLANRVRTLAEMHLVLTNHFSPLPISESQRMLVPAMARTRKLGNGLDTFMLVYPGRSMLVDVVYQLIVSAFPKCLY